MNVPASAQDTPRGHGSAIVVTEFAWTNAVNSDKNFDKKYTERGPTAPIVFWTRVQAERDMLDTFKKQGRFPIWHKWYVNCGATFRFDRALDPTDVVDLGVPIDRLLHQVESEVNSRGYFDWRTWSRKERVSSCQYTVRVVDNSNTILYCKEIEKDCELTIKLGE